MQEEIEEKKQDIQKDIKENTIILYMKGDTSQPQCGFSSQVVQVLSAMEVDFVTRDVLKDEVLRQAIKDFSDWPTVPQLYVKGEF
ncbi:MAG: monothiol glutaredoxin, Grx4 family, partial [Candidatus Margulisbacteria bacterium]|nr:monothiol glutaredoxin, Grx4 family [Candidatus Margulisiibacteriota bacterium]